ncbi:Zn-dependent hydrolase [Serratia grimesii]|uniref:Allantoate amidohydrolase n=1 Tax=Serratia grimesii TaxID=82995 RepID=A0ABR4U790_9GAMM|nr:Zn-dependent hydrolase [Serratia grimesii]KFB87892.1 allantoate amidohydrolase [Serratia grimesii]CAI0708007.1 N-carbamoyl-L-amino acid hydrolase [Serratia grimesii]CAI2439499.1 N-carbamoyl-L-amino acid hydrolase [Serratia grimesii]SUI33176.1 N-carbamoyl-L-amino acid hydrolase [Serratia grimesii]
MTELINSERLWARVNHLAQMTLPDVPWTRRAFTPLFSEARIWLAEQMQLAGLTVTLDEGGNLIGRRAGLRNDLAPIVTGSHCDTVVGGGRYDGIIGVLAGIEIAHCLHQQAIALQHPFEVIDFLSEEPSDYGISCVGSRALSGELDSDMLAAKNAQGETLAEAMTRIGAQPEKLTQPLRLPGGTAAYIELHIEQGPVLERQQLPIGVVTHIVGIRRVLVTVIGQPDHSGTTPMDIRRDALVGAAHVIEQADAAASRQSGNPHYVVATVGRIAMTPNVPNAVPGRVELMLEVRSDSQQVLDSFPEVLRENCLARLQTLGLQAELQHVSRARPTACAETVMQAIDNAAQSLGLASRRLPSGAGHDAVYMAPTGPVGMVFIPCVNGRSHCPEESITEQQLADGARVLAQALINLDKQLA